MLRSSFPFSTEQAKDFSNGPRFHLERSQQLQCEHEWPSNPFTMPVLQAPILGYISELGSPDTTVSGGIKWKQVDDCYLAKDPACDILGLEPATAYYFRVKCRNAAGDSDFSKATKQSTLTYAGCQCQNGVCLKGQCHCEVRLAKRAENSSITWQFQEGWIGAACDVAVLGSHAEPGGRFTMVREIGQRLY